MLRFGPLARLFLIIYGIAGLLISPLRADSVTDSSGVQSLLDSSEQSTQNGDQSSALVSLLQAQQEAPNSTSVTTAVENFVSAGLPAAISQDQLSHLPVTSSNTTNINAVVVTPADYIASTATEPQHGWVFGRITYVFVSGKSGDGAQLTQFCRLHYASPDDASFARRVGSLLLIAHNTLVQRTNHPPYNDDRPFDVWICNAGQMAGEQWQDNIYFYDLSTQRSSIEWIREIVHEYSHLALPAIGGFTAPEYWANGYLGERLIVRWMAQSADTKSEVEKDWGDFSGEPNFDQLLIQPPLDLYHKEGPKQAWLERTDEPGMRYFIGRMLAIDDRYGSKFLGIVLSNFPHYREARPTDLPQAFAEADLMQKGLHT